MTVIEYLKSLAITETPGFKWRLVDLPSKHLKALIAYYEAAEEELKYVIGASGDTPEYRRLKKARAELKKEDTRDER